MSGKSLPVWLEASWADGRLAARNLVRRPVFALVAVITLALGIGANTAVFSVISAVFLRPLPYSRPERLVWSTEYFPNFQRAQVFLPEYAAWREHTTAFEHLEAYGISAGVNFAAEKQSAERVQAGHVTPGFFTMLGVTPQLGRTFREGETDRVTIISDPLWRGYFHADPEVLHGTVVLDGAPATIIGVMPRGFVDPGAPDAGVWLADAVDAGSSQPGRSMRFAGGVIGRLRPGVMPEQARADLTRIARSMDDAYPTPWSRYHRAASVRVVPLREQLSSSSKTAIFVLAGAVGFVLLIVCANVASMFLARALARQREMATRAAMGASRARLVRLLLSESILLGAAGGLLAAMLAHGMVSVLGFLLPAAIPQDISLDACVLAFATLCSLLTGVLFGLAPAFTASKIDLNNSLKQGGARTRQSDGFSLRSMLAVTQIALSLVLLAGAGLLIRSFYSLVTVNAGFNPRNVLLAEVSLAPIELYGPKAQADFYRRVLEAIRGLPGVEAAAVTDESPLSAFQSLASGLAAEGSPSSDATVVPTSASADYFRTLQIPLLGGRFFDSRDRQRSQRVAILNRRLAEILFPHRDAIGRRVRFSDEKDPWVTVVGVVADIRHRALDSRVWPEIFLPYQQAPASWMSLVVRSSGDPMRLAPAIRKAVAAIDRTQPVFNIESLEKRLSNSVAERRQRAWLLGTFALLALAIAIVGVYGMMAYSVARRSHEMGIRVALGAQKRQIFGLVFTGGMKIVFAGIVIGLAGAAALTRVVRSMLYGITPSDPVTFVAACMLLTAAACVAIYVPARRAMRVDPVMTLREE